MFERCEAQIMTVEEMINSIEFSAIQQQVFAKLKEGNKVFCVVVCFTHNP